MIRNEDALQLMKEKARNNTTIFVDYFLKMPVPLHIQEWYSKIDDLEYDRILIRAPRRHAKSTAITMNFLTKYILYNPDSAVLVIGLTDKLSMGFMRKIRDNIVNNKRIRVAFPEALPLSKDTEHELILNRKVARADPTIASVGRMGTVTGRAINLLVVDDIIDRYDAYSPTLMDKLWDWFLGEVFNTLEPDARVIVVGTMKRVDDIYARIEEKWA